MGESNNRTTRVCFAADPRTVRDLQSLEERWGEPRGPTICRAIREKAEEPSLMVAIEQIRDVAHATGKPASDVTILDFFAWAARR